MRHYLPAMVLLALALTACGKGQSGSAPTAGTSSSAGSDTVPPTWTAPEELVYDPIDTSKLQNTWWEQFNKGG